MQKVIAGMGGGGYNVGMKISDTINQLQSILSTHGDLELVVDAEFQGDLRLLEGFKVVDRADSFSLSYWGFKGDKAVEGVWS